MKKGIHVCLDIAFKGHWGFQTAEKGVFHWRKRSRQEVSSWAQRGIRGPKPGFKVDSPILEKVIPIPYAAVIYQKVPIG